MDNEEAPKEMVMTPKEMVMTPLEAIENFQMITYTLKRVQKRGFLSNTIFRFSKECFNEQFLIIFFFLNVKNLKIYKELLWNQKIPWLHIGIDANEEPLWVYGKVHTNTVVFDLEINVY